MPDPSEPAGDNANDSAPENGAELRPPFRPASYDPVSLRHIDWRAAFPFVNVFRGFRIAAHPSKLVLAVAAVLLLYFGGRVMDFAWSTAGQRAVPGEARAFERFISDQQNRGISFELARRAEQAALLDRYDALRTQAAYAANRERIDGMGESEVESYLVRERDRLVRAAQGESDRLERQRQVREAYDWTASEWNWVTEVNGRGIFAEFYDYEAGRFNDALGAIVNVDPRGLWSALRGALFAGPLWGFSQHPIYFTIFFLWMLVLGAVFGGAISRIAAVEVARDEKISFRSALRFSSAKFVSFVSAPLIPLLIVIVLALLIALPGLLANVPWGVGDIAAIIIGAAFFLALLVGFIITLVLVGLAGGFSLMYPTIAAEGTDSFDAISRSFSYLYARPWRLGGYALMGLLYGAITYLFVRLFAWLVLASSHAAVGLLMWRDVAGQPDTLHAIWPPPPTYSNLSYDIPFINLSGMQSIAAVLLSLWVYLMVALVAAYAVSLYYSISTIIYFLMRREVDATELDDVYLDPHDEEMGGYSDVPEADTQAPIDPEEPAEAKSE